ncbi:hypothetical protein A0H76_1663 [Hepatospora eriocheir]|uniref:Uncharacterized protein n=1 Tax=Hepatospora eriocheir TaxID=1081669 RepID=A0A1X0QKP4_9MICR|nr:hypothetical protein A0H76_1663 [Hepatospora eriocheir]
MKKQKNELIEIKKQKTELIELFRDNEKLKKEMKSLDASIFIKEAKYLGSIPNDPVTRNLEYYLNGTSERKRSEVNPRDIIFSVNYPK